MMNSAHVLSIARAGLTVLCLAASLATAASPALAAPGTPLSSNGLTLARLLSDRNGRLWLSDSVRGFCKLDPTSGGIGPCDNTARTAGQAALDPAGKYAFVADQSTTGPGVVRVTLNADGSPVRGSGVAIGDGMLTGWRASSVAFGTTDNSLYVGSIKTGQLARITNPTAALGQQTTQIVGRTTDGRGVLGGLAMVGDNLYIAELGGNGVSLITGVSTCNVGGVGGGCQATLTSIESNFPGGLNTDGQDVLYVGDSAVTNIGTVLRYRISTDTQDTLLTNVPPYTSAYDGPHSRYTGITGLAVMPNGDLFVADDPTLNAATPPTGQGMLWKVPGVATTTADCAASQPPCADALGGPGQPAVVPPPAAAASDARLLSFGQTSPVGIALLGTHYWVADHTQGLCRLDPVPSEPGIDTAQTSQRGACDPSGGIIGSPGQLAYDRGSGFVYVPDDSTKSPGVWRLHFDPAGEGTVGQPTLLAPGAGLDAARLIGVALGPDGSLYAAGLRGGSIYRITNPAGDPASMTVDIIGQTSDNRGINGTIGFIGNDLYLPENRGLAVLSNATGCGHGSFCTSSRVSIQGLNFAQSVATNGQDKLYVSTAAGGSDAIIFRYVPATGAATIYADRGQLPTPSAAATREEFCSETCVHVASDTPFGKTVGFHFVIGMYVDPTDGSLLVGDDPMAGVRGFRGHLWQVAAVN